MGGAHSGLSIWPPSPRPSSLDGGLQGAGKTTTTGKFGKMLVERDEEKVPFHRRLSPPRPLPSCRPSQQAGIEFFLSTPDQKPVDIARASGRLRPPSPRMDVVDNTAGRLAIDQAMMEEIQALHAAVNPIETLFVG